MRTGVGILLFVLFTVGLLVGSAQAETLYGITFGFGSPTEVLITIDTATGVGTLVGPLSSSMNPFGLGTRAGKLYTFDQTADRITELDPASGATLATIDIGVSTSGEGAITFRSDGIGFLSQSAGGVGTLWSFDITGPSSTPITTPGGLVPSMDGMDFSLGGILYAMSQDTSALYTIDQATGATTLIGDTGFDDINFLTGLAFRSDGVLFTELNDSLYTVNVTTGVATLIGPIGFTDISGLTFLEVDRLVPESSTLMMLGSGLAGLALARRRRPAASG